MKNPKTIATAFVCLALVSVCGNAQTRSPVGSCKQAAFEAIRTLPKFAYECPPDLNDSAEQILKSPERVAALNNVLQQLKSFNDPAWWDADVNDLTVCEFHGQVGRLSTDERAQMRQGDYHFSLFGNHHIRLVLLLDPCYQTGYNGSVGFLLNRVGNKTFVTTVLEGYYSRVDNSVGIDFAKVNGEEIIEITTANNMPPAIRNYYYSINPRTHQAVARNLFKDGKKLTNEISSEMILGEPTEMGLPANAVDTIVMHQGRLRRNVTVYEEAYVEGNDQGRKLRRKTFRWNGRVFVAR